VRAPSPSSHAWEDIISGIDFACPRGALGDGGVGPGRQHQRSSTTSSCPAQPRRSPPPERLPSPSSPGSPRRERAAHLQRGAVWRRRVPRRKPSASVRLDAAFEPARSTETGLRATGSTRPWARNLPGIGPNRYPLPGVIRLEFLSPKLYAEGNSMSKHQLPKPQN